MSDIRLEVYIYFKGQCREAMEFYKSVFGGELEMMSYADTPGDMPLPEGVDSNDWLMHANLTGGDVNLMASDTAKASPLAAKIDLSIGGTDEIRMREIFGKLSTDGKINSPLKKEFWGDTLGSLTDKFGVNWMMNIGTPKGGQDG
ncbi:MAG TPA: VOC family protein [Candidatus Saccharimonadales bacterium]|nr:VOC family protein [Candidatus Saccharimonadales bacterium]